MRLKTNEVLFTWPLAAHTITAGWYYSDGSLHRAIDLRAIVWTPVYAAEDGTVDWVQAWDGHSTSGDQSYGNLVRIRHADYNGGKLQTLYAHLSESRVKYGQRVREGDLIGYSGNTGHSTGPHLHFEVRMNGARCNPLNWLDSNFCVANSSVRLGSYTSVQRPAAEPDGSAPAELAAGAQLSLHRCPLYVGSTATSASGTVTGTYYLWDNEQIGGRVRITNAAERVGKAGQVTGWINVSDAAAALTDGNADKPGTTLTIGPVSSGDRDTIRSKCVELQLMGLYHETEDGGLYTITVGPLSAGDVATLKALCEQLQLVEMGLCKES